MQFVRLVQDDTGSIDELGGQSLERLICIETVNADVDCRSPALFLFKTVESSNWHRFFLEAGICFWDRYAGLPEDDLSDPEDYPWYDLAEREGLQHTTIRSVRIRPHRQGVAVTFRFHDGRRLAVTTATMEDDMHLTIDK